MYQASYAETLESAPGECRERERLAFGRAIELMRLAEAAGPGSPESAQAIDFLCRLWRVLLDDLTSPDNDLPETLRGDLVSIGIWVLRQADDIRGGRSSSFGGVVEVCAMIRDGLK